MIVELALLSVVALCIVIGFVAGDDQTLLILLAGCVATIAACLLFVRTELRRGGDKR